MHTEFGGKQPHGRCRRLWEDNIKMELTEIGCQHGRWVEMTQDHVHWEALLLAVLNLQVLLPESCNWLYGS